MDEAGIDISVLSLTTPGVQGEKGTKTAIHLVREANDVLAREVQERQQRFAGFAALPLQDPAAAANGLQRAIKDLGFKGALINGQTNCHYLDEERFLAFWERVQELDVPVYLHPGELPDQPAMFAGRPELEGPVWAWTADTGAHALRLIFAGIFKRFPRLKVVLGAMEAVNNPSMFKGPRLTGIFALDNFELPSVRFTWSTGDLVENREMPEETGFEPQGLLEVRHSPDSGRAAGVPP